MKIRSNSIAIGINHLTNNKWYEVICEFTYNDTKVIINDNGNEMHVHLTNSYFLGGGDWEVMEEDDEDKT